MTINSTDGKTDAEMWPAGGLENVPRCPVCGSDRRKLLHEGLRDRVFRCAPGQWNLQLCGSCGSGYLDPRPTVATIGLAYSKYYTHIPTGGLDYSKAFWWRRFRIAQRHQYLNNNFDYDLKPVAWYPPFLGKKRQRRLDRCTGWLRFPGAGARMLDIGCGNGVVLQQMRLLGWDVCGVEPDPKSAAQAQAAGLDVRTGMVQEQKFPEAHFDAITMNHVIEHLHDPMDTVRTCYRLLKPGGHISVVTPNLNSCGHQHFGADWMPLDPPRHLVLFNEASLKGLLEACGFSVSRPARVRLEGHKLFKQSWVMRQGGDPMEKHARLSWLERANLFKLAAAADRATLSDPARTEELVLLGQKPK